MNNSLRNIILLALLLSLSANLNSKELVREFKGTGDKTTVEFEVKAPWIIDWRATGDYPGSMALQVNLISSPRGEYVGKITSTNWVSNGVKLFNEGGTFRFQVDSSLMDWTLRVEQLSEEEAKTYIPKNEE